MVGVSGIRGRVGDGLTPEVVARFAAAFGAWALAQGAARTVVLGRDSRVTGPLFHQVARAALEAVGADVIDIGLTTTPTLQLAVEHHHAAGGIALTASHNPIEWNALKFIGADGLFLSDAAGRAMRALVEPTDTIPYATWDRIGTMRADPHAIERHIDAVLALPLLDVPTIRARRFTVAYDACRGAGGAVLPRLLETLGCTVHAIELEPDGRFPRPPEPIPENLGALAELTKATGADIGFATDPDVDRLACVLDGGEIPGEDYTLALAVRAVLRRRPGLVVTNLSSSVVIDDAAAAFGQRVERAPVGEVNVAIAMRERGAVVGGEGNGGVILPDLHLGRDAPLAAALVLQCLVDEGRAASAVIATAPRYHIVKDKLPRPQAPLDSVYAALRSAFPDAIADTQDGLRLGWPDRWIHVRPSNTEPIVRVIAEAPARADAIALIVRGRRELDAIAG
ncbi:MAG: phosphoglucosamine mutase [Gemmatimonadaceae bacterium]|nr:phosphoglucosamine mutase [Gemmatimonadaceae bacterium]